MKRREGFSAAAGMEGRDDEVDGLSRGAGLSRRVLIRLRRLAASIRANRSHQHLGRAALASLR